MPAATAYETAVSDFSRYVKQTTGIQQQFPKSIKHGGDTRPWTSKCQKAETVQVHESQCNSVSHWMTAAAYQQPANQTTSAITVLVSYSEFLCACI